MAAAQDILDRLKDLRGHVAAKEWPDAVDVISNIGDSNPSPDLLRATNVAKALRKIHQTSVDESVKLAASRLLRSWDASSAAPAAAAGAGGQAGGADFLDLPQPPHQMDDLSKSRKTLCRQFLKVFEKAAGKQGDAMPAGRQRSETAALLVEEALFTHFGGGNMTKPKYGPRFHKLLTALKGNEELVIQVLLGVFGADELVTADPKDLRSDASKARSEKFRKEGMEEVQLDWAEKNEEAQLASAGISSDQQGALRCGKCNSFKTKYRELQTRSADEPTTKFCRCIDCGHRWTFC